MNQDIHHQRSARGKFELRFEAPLLISCVRGQWNGQTAKRYADQLVQIIDKQAQGPWANLVLMDDWGLGTPDIEPEIRALVDWCFHQGGTRVALVYRQHPVKHFQLDRMMRKQRGDFLRESFEHWQDALVWLDQQGFACPPSLQQWLVEQQSND
ncbi:hypothetical protein LJ739_10885 [Aestuariibacter halophilus]|uniref:STAS/SEC14 domain-containing protein n=1 Tax=Fluctibacter halophilus TaxID=226011 RepID=A0ABS8G847_9ALTE|nr:hypothetical protein [Aestuariibacter halophilus]MCC2616747.1 hypothetical protein [Aestuariibacter halophilus]